MKPILNGPKTEFNDQIIVQRLDAVESGNAALMQEYGVRRHPSFVLLGENGRVIQTFFGPQEEEILRTTIQNNLP